MPRKPAVNAIAAQIPKSPKGVKDKIYAKGTLIRLELMLIIDGGNVLPLPLNALVAANSKLANI